MTLQNEPDREQHLNVARHLAREMGMPEATVIEAYSREIERLSASAQVTKFLDVLTVKHVKAALRSRGSTPL